MFDRVGSALGNLVPYPAVAAGKLVAGRCDNDTTHQLRPDSGPRLRQLLIIDGSQGPGLASNCITGYFSIAICESCGDVCRVAINSHCSEMQSFPPSLSCFLSFCLYVWRQDIWWKKCLSLLCAATTLWRFLNSGDQNTSFNLRPQSLWAPAIHYTIQKISLFILHNDNTSSDSIHEPP